MVASLDQTIVPAGHCSQVAGHDGELGGPAGRLVTVAHVYETERACLIRVLDGTG